MTSTRCRISAKQLKRELGVHDKTVWRMFNKIRTELMADDDQPLEGDVEVDETSWGGKPRGLKKLTPKQASAFREAKTTILRMVERDGRLRLRIIPSRRGEPLSSAARTHVNPDAFLFTDDWIAYKPLRKDYAGAVINHSEGQCVDAWCHTNTIEGAFGNLKTGMRGTYKHVGDKHLQSYLDEYVWRYNHRNNPRRAMFHEVFAVAAK